jgi:MazG family protein
MGKQFERLVDIVEKLRMPGGCPWDREQTHKSLLSGLLEESYEFFEAVDADNPQHMCEELGDIMLQVVFHAQIARENKQFDIEAVSEMISDKLIRRHPHVFGDVTAESSQEVLVNWEAIKRTEKGNEHRTSVIDGIPEALPALYKAEKLQKRVARVGFDWPDIKPVLDKVEEEFAEFREALESDDHHHAEEELGDILFALVNVARHKDISAEEALRRTIGKFDRRFRFVEEQFKKTGREMTGAALEEMDVYWEESKKVVG